METQANRFPNSLIWIAGIAIILFCATGIAAIMGWIPTSMGHGSDDTALGSADRSAPKAIAPGNAGVQFAPDSRSTTLARSNDVSANVTADVPAKLPAHRRCAECGVIESTRHIETRGQASGMGAIGGGLLGGVLGNQVGGGRGQDLATVVGAAGGVVAGNEIEKRMKSTQGYNITVRLHDGSSRVVHEVNPPMWRNGDYVKIVDGVIHSN